MSEINFQKMVKFVIVFVCFVEQRGGHNKYLVYLDHCDNSGAGGGVMVMGK